MNEVFADTSGWASVFVRTEAYHVMAAAFLRQWRADGTQVVTTNYVINEVSALLTSPQCRLGDNRSCRPGFRGSRLRAFPEQAGQALEPGGLCKLRSHAAARHCLGSDQRPPR